MVVFNNKHVTVFVEDFAKLTHALSVECRACGILCSRGQNTGDCSTLEHLFKVVGTQTVIVYRYWFHNQP